MLKLTNTYKNKIYPKGKPPLNNGYTLNKHLYTEYIDFFFFFVYSLFLSLFIATTTAPTT